MAIHLSRDQQREIGGLLLSCVQVSTPMMLVRAAQWRNTLGKVGLAVPFWVVADLGLLLSGTPERIDARPGLARLPQLPREVRDAHATWLATLRELAETEMAERARAWRLSDDLTSIVLLRVLGPIWERHLGPGRRPVAVPLPLDPQAYEDLGARLEQAFASVDRRSDAEFLARLAAEAQRLVTAFEQIDLDTLRLLGMYGAEASAASAFGMLDLLSVLESPDANDVVNFSLDLLPSVLETKRATGAQTFSVDGYAGLARRGTMDSLVLTELAYDDDLFDQRFSENEVFYYARDKTREEDRRLHYIVCDATASMRGQRSVFARGLALTLVKKMLLRGEDVAFRFFDSRLYDVQIARATRRKTERGIDVPYVLSFRGEHGRHYAKVFGMLAGELARTAKREGKAPVLYVITHAECHVPLDIAERLRSTATLYGIFMLPSGGQLDLEWSSRLHTVQVVSEETLGHREERNARARDILDDAAPGPRASLPPGASRKSLPPRVSSPDLERASELQRAEAELEAYLRGGT